jgi:hypothetical protein
MHPTWARACLAFSWLVGCAQSGGATPHDAGKTPDSGADRGGSIPCGGGGEGCCGAQKTCHSGLSCTGGVCARLAADSGDTGGSCAFVRCGGVCTDTISDAKNCGGCGHDCQGTTCSASLCQAKGIALGNKPVHLAVDTANVYFTDGDGTVNQVPSAGGTIIQLASSPSPYGITYDASFVYFTSQGTPASGYTDGAVLKVPIGGGDAGAAIPLATGRPKPQAIAVDGLDVYWLEPGATTTGALLSCPLAGCPSNVPNVVYGMLALPYGLALDSTNVYLTTSAGGQVLSFSKSTGASNILTDSQDEPAGITVSNGKVYWATTGGGLIQVIPATGGASSHVATTMGAPQAVAADAVNVYWSDNSPDPVTTLGPVDSCAVSGCPPSALVTLVGEDQTAADIAIDSLFVYWIGTGGQILRVAK